MMGKGERIGKAFEPVHLLQHDCTLVKGRGTPGALVITGVPPFPCSHFQVYRHSERKSLKTNPMSLSSRIMQSDYINLGVEQ